MDPKHASKNCKETCNMFNRLISALISNLCCVFFVSSLYNSIFALKEMNMQSQVAFKSTFSPCSFYFMIFASFVQLFLKQELRLVEFKSITINSNSFILNVSSQLNYLNFKAVSIPRHKANSSEMKNRGLHSQYMFRRHGMWMNRTQKYGNSSRTVMITNSNNLATAVLFELVIPQIKMQFLNHELHPSLILQDFSLFSEEAFSQF